MCAGGQRHDEQVIFFFSFYYFTRVTFLREHSSIWCSVWFPYVELSRMPPPTGAEAALGDFRTVKQGIHSHGIQILDTSSSSSSVTVFGYLLAASSLSTRSDFQQRVVYLTSPS